MYYTTVSRVYSEEYHMTEKELMQKEIEEK